MASPSVPPTREQRRARQKRSLLLLAIVLLAVGASVLFLKRMPLPLRLGMGFVDIVAGLTLLVFRRQNYSDLK